MQRTPRLRALRERAALSQENLAEISHVARATIADLEAGKRPARPSTIRKLAEGLGVEVTDLYGEPDSPLGESPPSLQPTLNGALEEARQADWSDTVADAQRLREHGRVRMPQLLAAWRASKERGEPSAARGGYLDEMGDLLQQAYDAVTALGHALSEAGRVTLSEVRIVEQWPELVKADRFYIELRHLVNDAGLTIRTGADESAREQGEAEMRPPGRVEERNAA